MTRERGSVTAFVVGIVTSLVALAGLVHDGGRLVAAHVRAADQAAGAARAGAQEVTGIRAGHVVIDIPAAAHSARRHVATLGAQGRVEVTPYGVTVTVRVPVGFALLSLVGLEGREVSATRTAVVVRQ